jgi:hypothetical protein
MRHGLCNSVWLHSDICIVCMRRRGIFYNYAIVLFGLTADIPCAWPRRAGGCTAWALVRVRGWQKVCADDRRVAWPDGRKMFPPYFRSVPYTVVLPAPCDWPLNREETYWTKASSEIICYPSNPVGCRLLTHDRGAGSISYRWQSNGHFCAGTTNWFYVQIKCSMR